MEVYKVGGYERVVKVEREREREREREKGRSQKYYQIRIFNRNSSPIFLQSHGGFRNKTKNHGYQPAS